MYDSTDSTRKAAKQNAAWLGASCPCRAAKANSTPPRLFANTCRLEQMAQWTPLMLPLYCRCSTALPSCTAAAPGKRCAGRPPCGRPPACLSPPAASVSTAHMIAVFVHKPVRRPTLLPMLAWLRETVPPAAPHLTAAQVEQDQWQTEARPAIPVHIPDHSRCDCTCRCCSRSSGHVMTPLKVLPSYMDAAALHA